MSIPSSWNYKQYVTMINTQPGFGCQTYTMNHIANILRKIEVPYSPDFSIAWGIYVSSIAQAGAVNGYYDPNIPYNPNFTVADLFEKFGTVPETEYPSNYDKLGWQTTDPPHFVFCAARPSEANTSTIMLEGVQPVASSSILTSNSIKDLSNPGAIDPITKVTGIISQVSELENLTQITLSEPLLSYVLAGDTIVFPDISYPSYLSKNPDSSLFKMAKSYFTLGDISDVIFDPTIEQIKKDIYEIGPISLCDLIPGHCVAIIGYDDATQMLSILNSAYSNFDNPYPGIQHVPYSDFIDAKAKRTLWYRTVTCKPRSYVYPPYAVRINITHPHGRCNLRVAMHMTGHEVTIWDQNNRIYIPDPLKDLVIDVPLPTETDWPPGENNRCYIDISDYDPVKDDGHVVTVNDIVLVDRTFYKETGKLNMFRPDHLPITFSGGYCRIVIPSGQSSWGGIVSIPSTQWYESLTYDSWINKYYLTVPYDWKKFKPPFPPPPPEIEDLLSNVLTYQIASQTNYRGGTDIAKMALQGLLRTARSELEKLAQVPYELDSRPVEELPGISLRAIKTLKAKGILTIGDFISATDIEEEARLFAKTTGISEKLISKWRKARNVPQSGRTVGDISKTVSRSAVVTGHVSLKR